MKILVIHHLEPLWEMGYSQKETSFEELERNAARYLRHNKFGKVILTNFELESRWLRGRFKFDSEFNQIYPNLARFITDLEEYGYGWEAESIENSPFDFVKGGNHSEAVYIPEWIKSLSNKKIYLCGAFDGECIEDMEIALDSRDCEIERVENLIV